MEDLDIKKYVFEVARDAGKIEIKNAVEEIFGVKVIKVTTCHVRGKESAWAPSPRAARLPGKRLWSNSARIPRTSRSSRAWRKEEMRYVH